MAVLAAYLLRDDTAQSLPDYLDSLIADGIGTGTPVAPDPADIAGFETFSNGTRAASRSRAWRCKR